MFFRNVGAFNHYMVQKPKRIPPCEALCDDVSYWLDIRERAQLGLLEYAACVMFMVTCSMPHL